MQRINEQKPCTVFEIPNTPPTKRNNFKRKSKRVSGLFRDMVGGELTVKSVTPWYLIVFVPSCVHKSCVGGYIPQRDDNHSDLTSTKNLKEVPD